MKNETEKEGWKMTEKWENKRNGERGGGWGEGNMGLHKVRMGRRYWRCVELGGEGMGRVGGGGIAGTGEGGVEGGVGYERSV